MGLFNFLQRRREREAAIPGGLPTGEDDGLGTPLTASTEFAPAPADVTSASAEAASAEDEVSSAQAEIPGLEGLGDLGQILSQAMSGNPSVTVSGESHVMNPQASSEDLRNSIAEILRSHGIDAEKEAGDAAVPGAGLEPARPKDSRS